MEQKVLSRDDIMSAAWEADVNMDTDFRDGYGGPYGVKCFGIVGDITTYGLFVMELRLIAEHNDESDNPGGITVDDLMDLVRDTREDGVGRRTIYYWPRYTLSPPR